MVIGPESGSANPFRALRLYAARDDVGQQTHEEKRPRTGPFAGAESETVEDEVYLIYEIHQKRQTAGRT